MEKKEICPNCGSENYFYEPELYQMYCDDCKIGDYDYLEEETDYEELAQERFRYEELHGSDNL